MSAYVLFEVEFVDETLVEFPSMERVREWYRSPEYARALRFRDAALKRRLMFFDGVPPG